LAVRRPRDPAADAGRQPVQRGRPRSDEKTRRILRTTADLLRSRRFSELTVDLIAAEAAVSKATIYRWWPNKSALAIDAFLIDHAPGVPFPDTGSTREDVRQGVHALIVLWTHTPTGPIIASLMAEAQNDAALEEAIRNRFLVPRRAVGKAILQRGIDRGELRADLDLEVTLDAIYGPIYHRLLSRHAPLDTAFANRLIDLLFDGCMNPLAEPVPAVEAV
jgi:AcrR family transcriptional regulator